jgi:glutamyl-tRNA synthetase
VGLSVAGLTGRFAPSPTGPLHLGSLRTALVAWLFARSADGRFLLRVEDLDPDRSRADWETLALSSLSQLGLDWDGAVVRQSERSPLYSRALAELEALGRVYPCFCTRAEIRAAASAPHRDLPAGAYPGTCRRLSPTERAERIRRGDRYALRFDAGAERVDFVDLLAGPQSFVADDFVLRRSDGVFAYQLAVVVDDEAQGVTQVARGADLMDSVARQLLLMRALGYPEPEWAHVPLVMGPDGRRLAKRYASSCAPGTPAETLALLAGSLGIAVEGAPRSAADLLSGFDPARIPVEPFALS